MKKAAKPSEQPMPIQSNTGRVLVLVDESNLLSSVRAVSRSLDWVKLRDYLIRPTEGRTMIEMIVYAGLPPAMPEWQAERDKKNKFLHWLRTNGFLVMAKDGAPSQDGQYKANVDVMLAIDALELTEAMRPDVVVLVTGDSDFAPLALHLRRRGIRVEAASTLAVMGAALRGSVNEVVDLLPLFESCEPLKTTTV